MALNSVGVQLYDAAGVTLLDDETAAAAGALLQAVDGGTENDIEG